MPAIQTSYAETIRPGVAGQIADMTDKTLVSRTIMDADGVGFGKVVQSNGEEGQITADLNTSAMTEQKFVGITVRERSLGAEQNKFVRYDSARVMVKGCVWVDVAVAVAPTDIVTVTLATGVIGKTAVGAGIVAIPRAVWETKTSGEGVAKLRLR